MSSLIRKEDKKLNEILQTLRELHRMMKYFLGTYSRYVGRAAEQLTFLCINRIHKIGGLWIDNTYIPPIEILMRNVRDENFEIDLLGRDPEGNYWIIETTTYPIFDESIVNRIYRRVQRWYNKNKYKPSFILFAYGGIEHGLYDVLSNRLKKICEKVIILNKIQSRKLVEATQGRKMTQTSDKIHSKKIGNQTYNHQQ